MNYEKNLKYFQSNDKHFYVGLGILAFDALLFVLTVFFHVYFMPYQQFLVMILAAAGAITAFVPLSKRSSEGEIDEAISQNIAGYDEKVIENTGITELITRKLKPAVLGDYVYEGDNIILRKGRDDRKYRSSIYKATALIFTKHGIYASQKTFSLIEESETEEVSQFIYEDIDRIEICDKEILVNGENKIKISFIVIVENDKNTLYIPAKSGAATDRLVEDINRYISEVKQDLR